MTNLDQRNLTPPEPRRTPAAAQLFTAQEAVTDGRGPLDSPTEQLTALLIDFLHDVGPVAFEAVLGDGC